MLLFQSAKLATIILLMSTATAIPTLSSLQIWLASFQKPLENLISNPLRRSIIPQFILDTQHPWILANQRKLERLPNTSECLCSSTESSRCGKDLEVPSDVFDKLEINNNRYGITRPGWANALQRLKEMKACPLALSQVKTFEIDIYIHESEYANPIVRILEPSHPPDEIMILFRDVLESMTSLETLKWGIPKEYTQFFGESFTARNMSLPSVRKLEPGPWSHYLVGMCPNLEKLRNGGGFGWFHGYMRDDDRDWGMLLIQATVRTPGLKRFAMEGGHRGWSVFHVSEIIRCMPQIESLGILGSIEDEELRFIDYDTDNNGQKFKEILTHLSPLHNLAHLNLPPSSSLGLGFDGGPRCGNAYFGKRGRIYLRQVTRRRAETTERAGEIVMAELPFLKGFSIGGFCADVSRVEGSMGLKIRWPWTGRMDEWLMEKVPDVDGDEL